MGLERARQFPIFVETKATIEIMKKWMEFNMCVRERKDENVSYVRLKGKEVRYIYSDYSSVVGLFKKLMGLFCVE